MSTKTLKINITFITFGFPFQTILPDFINFPLMLAGLEANAAVVLFPSLFREDVSGILAMDGVSSNYMSLSL